MDDSRRGRSRRVKSEYDAVTLQIHWPAMAFLAFALTLPFNYLRLWIWPERTALIVAGLTGLGLLAGLVGCADRRRRRWSLLAVALNGMVLVALGVIEWIYRNF